MQEGPEFGIGDFVLLRELTLDAFMENLKLRYPLELSFDSVVYFISCCDYDKKVFKLTTGES